MGITSLGASGRTGRELAACALLFLITSGAVAQLEGPTFEELTAEASVARDQNDPSRAIELYARVVQLNPKSSEAWWFLGSLEYRAGKYEPAKAALSQYLELVPDAAPALALRGLCEFETSDYSQALTDIQKGISLGAANDPRHQQILHYHEGLLLTRLGRFENALSSYSFFADQQITSPELMLAIGLAGLRMPLLPFEIRSDQQELVAAAGSAGYQLMSGDSKGAQQAFQNLFEKFPTLRNLHYFYGHLLFARDPDAAIEEFQNELRVSPESVEAQIMAAWVLLMEDRATEALPFAQHAVHLKAESGTAQLVLGKSLVETGKLKDGIESLEQALKLQPDDLEVHIALAKAYSKTGRKEDARNERMLCLQLTQVSGTHLASQ